jgi:hypothetical protein
VIGVVEAIERGYGDGEGGVGKEPYPDESSTERPILILCISSVRVRRGELVDDSRPCWVDLA